MSSQQQWLEQVVRLVEQDGTRCERIKLITTDDGQVWNSWFPPFEGADALHAEVQSYIRSLETEWPARQVGVALVAESRQGEVLTQLPMRVTGQARQGRVDSVAAANAVAFDSLASTFEKMQRLTNAQLDQARLQLEANVETIVAQTQLIRVYRHKEIEGTADTPTVTETLLQEHAPTLLELGRMYLDTKTKKG